MLQKPHRLIPSIMSVVLLLMAMFISIQTESVYETDSTAESSEEDSENKDESLGDDESSETSATVQTTAETDEMRGVWIPYMSLDMSGTDRSEESFKEKIDEILDACVEYKLNTVFIHVRPFGDAIYPSEYYPWSHIITGTQGQAPDYDPLEYIVEAAHDRGLEIHAWINPLRISTGSTPSELSSDNPYIVWQSDDDTSNDDYTSEYDGGIYLNPAYAEVRKYIIDGVVEIVENYDVDGIHFDDYFYPTDDETFDAVAYETYCESVDESSEPLSLLEWRTNNISSLIAGVYSAIHSLRDDVVFGISPQGNIENDELMGADVRQWCSVKGYIDYICPQIYVSNTHLTMPFYSTAEEWSELVTCESVVLYAGLGLYKAGSDADDGTWLETDDEIKTQIEAVRTLGFSGFALYSYEYLDTEQTKKEIQNVMALLESE